MNRRDFLKLTCAATGGVILSSCGSNGNHSGGIPTPNGYKFFRIAGPGSRLPDGSTVAKMGLAPMINDNAEIILFVDNSFGKGATYEARMDYSGQKPRITDQRKVVAEGDTVGGFEVNMIGYGSTNGLGHHACVLKMVKGLNGVYADRDKTGMHPIVLPTGVTGGTDDPEISFHNYFGDVDMDDNGDMLFKAVFHNKTDPFSREGLFHLDADTGKKTVLAEEGAELPGGDEKIQAFGLLDIAASNGHYAAQVFGPGQNALGVSSASGKNGTPSSSIITGNISPSVKGIKTLAASAGASLMSSQRASVLTGDIRFGPRIGHDGRVAQVIHKADDFPVLYFDGKEIISKGDLSPLNYLVKAIGAPIVAESGLVYFCLECENNEAELCIYNGVTLQTILASGDPVHSAGLFVPIQAFTFGALRDMMDNAGRIVMTGIFDDGHHVVVGIPY